jgi:hypothetical protein
LQGIVEHKRPQLSALWLAQINSANCDWLDYRDCNSRVRSGLLLPGSRDGQGDGSAESRIGKASPVILKLSNCDRAKRKVGAQNVTQLLHSAFLLCSADMAVRFSEWLNGVGSIEMRYFDLRGKLIAKQRLECTVPARRRK